MIDALNACVDFGFTQEEQIKCMDNNKPKLFPIKSSEFVKRQKQLGK